MGISIELFYIIIYFLIFVMGTFLGSFCTLAVYRIPLKQNITHERSYCVNCKHRLEFLDLIPVLSYVFLGGRCRYCKEKIRPRYLLLEISFGLTFMLFVMSINLNWLNLTITNLVELISSTLYLVTIFLIAGIDKENKNIHKSVLTFGVVSAILYIVYLYIVNINIYRYVIYIAIILILAVIEKTYFNNKNYILQIISLIVFMLLYTGINVIILTVLFTSLTTITIKIAKNKKIGLQTIGFYLCAYNVLFLIIQNFINLF